MPNQPAPHNEKHTMPEDQGAEIAIGPSTNAIPRKYHVIAIAILTITSLIPIWYGEYFPTQNSPWTLLSIHMLREFDNPAFDYSEFYRIRWHPIPYLSHTVLVYALTSFCDVFIAHKLALSLYVLMLPSSVFVLLRSLNRPNLLWGYLSYLLIYNWPLFRGYLNYVQGLPVLLLVFAYWHSYYRVPSWRRLPWMALLILLVYFCHPFWIATLGILMTACFFLESRNFITYTRSVLLPYLPAFVLGFNYLRLTSESAAWIEPQEFVMLPVHRAAEYFFRRYFLLYSPRVSALSFIPVAILVGVLLVKAARKIAQRWFLGSRDLRRDKWLAMLAILVVLYFLIPYKCRGWHYSNLRLVPVVLVFAMVAASPIRTLRLQATYLAGIFAFAMISYASICADIRRINVDIKAMLSGLPFVNQNEVMMPIIIDNPVVGEQLRPLTRVYEYYHIHRGGANGDGWGRYNTITPVWYKYYPIEEVLPVIRPGRHDAEYLHASMDTLLAPYDYLLFWGRDQELFDLCRAHGFAPVHVNGQLSIFRAENNDARGSKSTAESEPPGCKPGVAFLGERPWKWAFAGF